VLLERRSLARQAPNQFNGLLLVARGCGKKDEILGPEGLAHAIHTHEKFHKKGWTGRALKVWHISRRERSSRDFLSGFAAHSYQNVSRDTFWYD
jgi:hypothetical protein